LVVDFPDPRQLEEAVVVCVGDAMLDRFLEGEASRISPEAPVPVVRLLGSRVMPGGAANTAVNAAALGASVSLVAPIGVDEAGRTLVSLLDEVERLDLNRVEDARCTTVKTRYSAGGQQLLRIDEEDTTPIDPRTADRVLALVRSVSPTVGVLVLSDYAKGALSRSLCEELIGWANHVGVQSIVDPKGSDFARYAGATVVTPNESEMAAAIGCSREEIRAAEFDGSRWLEEFGFETLIVTRGERGISIYQSGARSQHIASHARTVFDVSGAGDSFVAGLACGLACGQPLQAAAGLANSVAGVAVSKPGTAKVAVDEVVASERRQRPSSSVIVDESEEIGERAREWRDEGLRIGLTNGVFDLLHEGHLRSIKVAADGCDRLIVAINSDDSTRRLKGPDRPVHNQMTRSAVLAALEMVDLVVVFEGDTPINVIRAVLPDLLVKGGDYLAEEVVGYDDVVGAGGEVLIVPTVAGASTTAAVAKARRPDG